MLAGISVSYALYYALSALFAWLYSGVASRDRARAAHAAVCLTHNVYVGVAALRVLPASLLLSGGPELWHLRVDGFGTIAGFSAGFFIYDLCMCPLWQPPASPMLLVHHACARRAAPRRRRARCIAARDHRRSRAPGALLRELMRARSRPHSALPASLDPVLAVLGVGRVCAAVDHLLPGY
jgi:hypothetical protein